MTGPAPIAVAVQGLHVRRGPTAVFSDLNVQIAAGRITGLLGPSGCGKTTLMRSIVGVQKVQGGTVTVLGSPAGSKELRRRVAYDTQAASVYSDLTVEQNLRYFASVIGAPKTDVARVISQTGLTAQRTQTVEGLSGGQENRVSLAVAMLGSPDLMVLDEPTVGLDPVLRAELWDIFRSLSATGVTLLISSHVTDEAVRCDQLLLMRAGRVIADTTPAQFLASTGKSTPDDAFLTLVEEDEKAHPHTRRDAREHGSTR